MTPAVPSINREATRLKKIFAFSPTIWDSSRRPLALDVTTDGVVRLFTYLLDLV
jgi:hypothetical protein